MPYSRPHISTCEQVLPNALPSDQVGDYMVGDYMAYWHELYTPPRVKWLRESNASNNGRERPGEEREQHGGCR